MQIFWWQTGLFWNILVATIQIPICSNKPESCVMAHVVVSRFEIQCISQPEFSFLNDLAKNWNTGGGRQITKKFQNCQETFSEPYFCCLTGIYDFAAEERKRNYRKHEQLSIFTSREAAWSCRTVGRKKKSYLWIFLVFESLQPLSFGIF